MIANLIGLLNSSRYGGSTSPADLSDVLFAFKNIQRTDTDVSITCYTTGTATYSWQVINTDAQSVAASSSAKSPTFSGLSPGYYDLKVTITTPSDSYVRRWRRAFFMWYPQFTELEADEVIDLTTNTNFYYNYASANNSGRKIYIKGSGIMQLQFANLQGTAGWANQVRIQKEIGNTNINVTVPTAGSHTLYMYGATKHVFVDGFNTDGSAGFNIKGDLTNSAQVVVCNGGEFTDFRLMGCNISHAIARSAAGISYIPNTPVVGSNATNYVVEHMDIFCCTTNNTGEEGIYMGYNNDALQGGYRPWKFRDCVIARNTVTNSGRDGIQPGGCVNIEIHDNWIENSGLDASYSHESAISWNSGNYGKVFNNTLLNCNMFFNLQSGYEPWDQQAGQTTPQPVYFFSNVCINGTYPGTPEPFSIYGQNQNGGTSTASWGVHIFNNTFKCDKKFMEVMFHAASLKWTDFTLANNVIVKVGAAGDYDEVNFTGAGTQPTGSLINNLVKNHGSNESDIMFTNYAGNDLTISSLASPVYSKTTSDILAKLSGLDIWMFDIIGQPMTYENSYTFGAYSGYSKQIPDTTAPTLTTATIETAEPTKVVMVFSETVRVSSVAGFSIAGTTSTVFASISGDGTNILTGVLAVAATIGQTITLSYSAGNVTDKSTNNNLATISGRSVTNNVVPVNTPVAVVWPAVTGGTASGGTITSTSTSCYEGSQQLIPAASDGYCEYEWDSASRDSYNIVIGITVDGNDTPGNYRANSIMWAALLGASYNIDIYEGNGYKATANNRQVGTGGIVTAKYRFTVDRTADKVYFQTSENGGAYTTRYTSSGTLPSSNLKMIFFTTVNGAKVVNAVIQAEDGLI